MKKSRFPFYHVARHHVGAARKHFAAAERWANAARRAADSPFLDAIMFEIWSRSASAAAYEELQKARKLIAVRSFPSA